MMKKCDLTFVEADLFGTCVRCLMEKLTDDTLRLFSLFLVSFPFSPTKRHQIIKINPPKMPMLNICTAAFFYAV